jgi:hypothetical protein
MEKAMSTFLYGKWRSRLPWILLSIGIMSLLSSILVSEVGQNDVLDKNHEAIMKAIQATENHSQAAVANFQHREKDREIMLRIEKKLDALLGRQGITSW